MVLHHGDSKSEKLRRDKHSLQKYLGMPSVWIDAKATFHLPIPCLDKKLQLQNTLFLSCLNLQHHPLSNLCKFELEWEWLESTNICSNISPCWIIFLTHSWPQLNHFLIVQEEETSQSSIWENGTWKLESAVRTPIPEGTQDLTWEASEKTQGHLDQT